MDGVIVSRSKDSQFRFYLRHNMSLPNPTKPPSATHLTRPPRGYLEKRAPAPLPSRFASHRQQLPFPQRLDAPACIRDRSSELKSFVLHIRYRQQKSRKYVALLAAPHTPGILPGTSRILSLTRFGLFSSTGPSIRPILISGLP